MELTPRRASRERRRAGPIAARQVCRTIEGGDLAPGAARRAFDNFAAGALSERRRADARLLLSEIVTNSVRHAGAGREASIEVTFSCSDTLVQIVVRDQGAGFDAQRARQPADDSREGGRGLFLVNALADRWGVESGGPTRVWFEIRR